MLGSDDKPDTNSKYCGVFEKSAVRSVTLPETLKVIGDLAFKNCKNLNTVTLPTFLERLGSECFQESGLVSVTIPENVKAIGSSAFFRCNGLKTVRF